MSPSASFKDGSLSSLSQLLSSSISLLVIIIISVRSLLQLKSRKEIQKVIKNIYLLICIGSITATTTCLIATLLYSNEPDSLCLFLWTLFFASYPLVLCGVLAILLLRLYLTFRESVLEITLYQKWIFIVLYSFNIIITIILNLTYALSIVDNLIYAIYVAVASMIYFILSLYAMSLFSSKMFALMRMRQYSMDKGKPDTFDEKHKRLLYSTTKYVTLLSIAILSTFVFAVCGVFANYYVEIDGLVSSVACIDCVINIICLYLQYPFNNKYYDKYCKCFGNCCMYFFIKICKKKKKDRKRVVSDSTKERYDMKKENKNGQNDNPIQSKLRLPKKGLNELVPAYSNEIQNKNTELDGIGVVNHMNDEKMADIDLSVTYDGEQKDDGIILLMINSTKL